MHMRVISLWEPYNSIILLRLMFLPKTTTLFQFKLQIYFVTKTA